MALRVLLCDESSTIKKVFQLSLQDYAVEVCSVSVGLDALNAARQFKPDIAFCDVLLQKRSGYEVAADLKSDAQFRELPVILMWSGFMELDQDKFTASHATDQLEKPFDVEKLRKIIQNYVPKTRQQAMSQFLSFPKMPEIVESAPLMPPPGAAPVGGSPDPDGQWNMDSFDPIPNPKESEEFKEVPLPPPPKMEPLADVGDDEEDNEVTNWSTKPLNKFRVDLPEDQDDLAVTIEREDELEVEPLPPPPFGAQPPPAPPAGSTVSPLAPPPMAATAGGSGGKVELSEAQLERLVASQAKAIIESIAWKIVPDLANQIIERELKRLLDEKDAAP